MNTDDLVHIDASKFQQQLNELANTLALKVQREGPSRIPAPRFLCADIYILLRQAAHTYDLFFYLNADEKRHKEVGWKVAYGAVVLPLIRCMIDCLYNITAMLDNPARGFQFRASGYKKALEVLESDTHRYKGNAKWDAYNAKQRSLLDRLIKIDGFTLVDIQAATIWPTLGRYLRPASKGAPLTPHQQFLKKLTHGFWQEYSAVAHGTYDGILPIAVFFVPKDLPHDERARVDEFYERMIFMHISRVAAILLCMLTEVQAYFKFDGANINERLHKIWDVIVAAPEVKELYEERYEKLMTKI